MGKNPENLIEPGNMFEETEQLEQNHGSLNLSVDLGDNICLAQTLQSQIVEEIDAFV